MARPIVEDVTPRRSGRGTAAPRTETVACPRCGRDAARIIGRSEVLPIVYLRCDGCHLPSVTRA